MNDVTLALMGLCLGAGTAVGAWAALWWRDRVPVNERALYRLVFPYLDDRLGATAKENQIRAGKRFRFIHPRLRRSYLRLIPNWRKLPVRRKIADHLWAVPQMGTGSTPLPEVARIAQYITLEFGPTAQPKGLFERLLALFGIRPYRRWSIQAIQVRPTSEVASRAPQYPGSLLVWVAGALGLATADQVVIDPPADQTLDRGFLRYARKGPAPEVPMGMPVGVNVDA